MNRRKRRAMLRRLGLRVEWLFLVTIGVLGTACAAFFVASETYYLVSYVAERFR